MAPAATCAREGAIPAILGVRTQGLVRCGERPCDGKAAAHAGEPRCVRRVRTWNTHLHATQHASGSLSKKRHGLGRACGYSPRGPQLPVAAGAAETAALAAETVTMAAETVAMVAGATEVAEAADAAVQAVAAALRGQRRWCRRQRWQRHGWQRR